jgi:hypothetical protein
MSSPCTGKKKVVYWLVMYVVTGENVEGRTEVTRRRGRICKQQLDYLKER